MPASRPTSDALDVGSIVGAEKLPGRVVDVQGWMIARNAQAMWWAERWLTEALRGSMCKAGCAGDELNLLPYCPDVTDIGSDSGDPYEEHFRNLVATSLVDGPRFSDLTEDRCFIIELAQFQFVSQMPWLYSPGITEIDGETVASETTACDLITTSTWMDGEALVIRIDAPDGVASPGLSLSLTASLDGTCPEDRVAPWFTMLIDTMEPESYLVIDATRRRVVYYDPTGHREVPGFDRMTWYRGANPGDFSGGFCWPVLSPCTSVCVCATNGSVQDVTWTVTRSKREL